ncbi:MAG: hypothetical protein RBS80_07480 [Thermoguttaceae bacterium]|jgi:hypothetical protein|nr:hypothetical protein [Thermoguttaceae bacterium]
MKKRLSSKYQPENLATHYGSGALARAAGMWYFEVEVAQRPKNTRVEQ